MRKKIKQLSLFYKDLEVTADLYTLEYKNEQQEDIIEKFYGPLAYEEAVLKAYKKGITGIIVYPLTRSRQFVVAGIVSRRGRRSKKEITDRREGVFVKIKPSKTMERLPINFSL